MLKLFVSLVITTTLFLSHAVAQNNIYSVAQDSIQRQHVPVATTKHLIKGGIGLPLFRQSSVSPPWLTLGVGVTLEHKVKKGLSVIGSLETNFGFSRYAQLYSLEAPIGVRYYFSLGRRMKKRADRHSFFSHYLSVETHNVVFANLYYDTPNPQVQRYYRGQVLDHTTNVGNYSESLNLLQYAYVKIGSQVRIGRSNYLDLNAALPISNLIYHKTAFTLSTPSLLTIKYGIAW